MRHTLALVVLAILALPALAEEHTKSFLDGQFDDEVLAYSGRTPSKFLKPEKEGLRLRYTGADAPPSNNVAGVVWNFQARGDFSVTAKYEIVNAERPKRPGNGIGVELYLRLRNSNEMPKKEGIAFARLLTPDGEPAITFHHLITNAEGKRRAIDSMYLATGETTLRGRLRLARTGGTLTAFYAEGDAGPFKEFQKAEIGNFDVDLIRFAGLSGGQPDAVLDLRMFSEFTLSGVDLGYKGVFNTPAPKIDAPIKAEGPKNADAPAPAPPRPVVPDDPAPAGRRSSLMMLVIIAALLGLPLIVIVAVVVVLRLRKPKAAAEATAKPAGAPTKPSPRLKSTKPDS